MSIENITLHELDYGASFYISTTSSDVKQLQGKLHLTHFKKKVTFVTSFVNILYNVFCGISYVIQVRKSLSKVSTNKNSQVQDPCCIEHGFHLLTVVLDICQESLAVYKNLFNFIGDFSACIQIFMKMARCSNMSIDVSVFDFIFIRGSSIFGNIIVRFFSI